MSPRRKTDTGFALAIAALIFAVFGSTLGGDFLNWDDPVNVTNNPLITSLSWDGLRAIFGDFETAARYKPLSWLGWAVIHALYGLEPGGYHFANVTLHAINSALLFLIFLALGRRIVPDEKSSRNLRIAAVLGALFWAVHPLRVEAVAWVTGFPYGLSLLFMLLALLLYLRCDPARPAPRQTNYWLAVLACLLASLTYPTVLGFGAALIAIDFFPLQRFRRGDGVSFADAAARKVWLEKLPFLLIAGAMIGGTLFGVKHLSGGWYDQEQLAKATTLVKIMQALYMQAVYLWKTAAPVGLCPVYFDLFEISGREPRVLGGALLTLVVTWIAFTNVRRAPAPAALWFAHLGLMAPFLGVTSYPHYPSDRYSIIAGMVFAAGLFAFLLNRRDSPAFKNTAIVTGLVIAVAGAMSVDRSQVWLNDDTFFPLMQAQLPDGPHRSRAYFLHGLSTQNQGNHEAAAELYQRAWQVCAGEPPEELPFNFGVTLLHLQQFEAAVGQFEIALKLQGDSPSIRGNIGFALMQLGRFADAEKVFAELVREAPDNYRDRMNLALIRIQLDRPTDALVHLEAVRQQQPAFPPVYLHLARAYRMLGDEAAAARSEHEFRRLTADRSAP